MIITNNKQGNLKDIVSDFADKADKIRIATAFFSDSAFVLDWLDKSKKVDLLISLRPPTNYYSLKEIQPQLGIHIQFLGDDFHSKFFIFYEKGSPFACIIGSSNFTSGGLHKNIETNAILTDRKYLTEIAKHFMALWEQSYLLQPSDLADYKSVFDNFRNWAKQTQTLFSKLLSEEHIDRLSKEEAIEVFSNLHSTGRLIRQFHADKKFISANNIQQIRRSLKYLLYSNDDIGRRIHNLLTDPKLKLKYLGSSGVQEINGWTKPTEFPIRNHKADDALQLLDFTNQRKDRAMNVGPISQA